MEILVKFGVDEFGVKKKTQSIRAEFTNCMYIRIHVRKSNNCSRVYLLTIVSRSTISVLVRQENLFLFVIRHSHHHANHGIK